MNHPEVDAWLRWAAPETVQAVGAASAAAHNDWLARVRLPWEIYDGTPHRRCPVIFPGAAARAAGIAAAEVAIVASIWPDGLGEVLRPSTRQIA
jgi:hypothetical protein